MTKESGALLPRLALLLGGIAVAFALVEAGLRYANHGARPGGRYDTASPLENSRWIAHPFLPYAGRPSSTFDMYNGPERSLERVVTNAYGFRSHEFPSGKGPGDYYVLCFGGSTTYGYKAESNAATWPEILERKLQAEYPRKRITVFNLGLDMATNAVSLVNLALVGVHLDPDLVIVYHGYNDVASLGYRNFRTDQYHFYKDIDLSWRARGIQANTPAWLLRSYAVFYLTGSLDLLIGSNDLMQSARRPGETGPDRFKGIEATLRNFKTVDAITRGAGGTTLFSTFQFTHEPTDETFQRFNAELRRYFQANGMPYVDQAALIPDEDPTINVDACHFTPKGNEMMAENYFRWIVGHEVVR